jgi:hypothetical protein
MEVRPALLVCVVAAAPALGGCWSSGFVRTDPQYVARPAATAPEIFAERNPERHYRSVGYLEVNADAVVTENKIRSLAAREGRKLGCQVLIDRRLLSSTMFMNLRLALRATILVAHDGDHGPPKGASPSGSSGSSGGGNSGGSTGSPDRGSSAAGGWLRREFLCGFYVDS